MTATIVQGKHGFAPEIAARRFANLDATSWRYSAPALTWYYWGGSHWKAATANETDGRAANALRAIAETVRSARIKEVIDLAKLPDIATSIPTAISTPCVNFSNGTLDVNVTTGVRTLRHHNPDDGLIHCLPYPYKEGGQISPAMSDFLTRTIPVEEGRSAFLAQIGLALLGDTSIHKMILLIGPPRTGKSTLLRLAHAVVGDTTEENAGPVVFSSTPEGSVARARYASKTLVTMEEAPSAMLRGSNEDMYKILTAHGTTDRRLMYQGYTEPAQWRAKFIGATNNTPDFKDNSGAVVERMVIVRTPNTVPEAERNARLFQALAIDLPSLSRACIDAALDVLRTGRFPQSDDMRRDVAEVREGGNAVVSFVKEHCIVGPGERCGQAELFGRYKEYHDANEARSTPGYGLRGLTRALMDIYGVTQERSHGVRRLVGIRKREASDDLQEEARKHIEPVKAQPQADGAPQTCAAGSCGRRLPDGWVYTLCPGCTAKQIAVSGVVPLRVDQQGGEGGA